mmetsp:Transcript_19000/g.44332  ORF Transcript_19000/g.44332 Transcript_19000/m.44332 type:complete len:171 (-) Transcript_19000:25-537(-)
MNPSSSSSSHGSAWRGAGLRGLFFFRGFGLWGAVPPPNFLLAHSLACVLIWEARNFLLQTGQFTTAVLIADRRDTGAAGAAHAGSGSAGSGAGSLRILSSLARAAGSMREPAATRSLAFVASSEVACFARLPWLAGSGSMGCSADLLDLGAGPLLAPRGRLPLEVTGSEG